MARKKKNKMGIQGQIVLIAVIIAGVMALQTSMVLLVGMVPSMVAFFVDRTKKKTKAITVGALNMSGCSLFLVELWMEGHNFEKAMSIITDPMAIIVMYSAAAIGYLVDWAVSGMVAVVVYNRGKARLKSIKKRQWELIERWGVEVSGEVELDEKGFPVDEGVAKEKERELKKRLKVS